VRRSVHGVIAKEGSQVRSLNACSPMSWIIHRFPGWPWGLQPKGSGPIALCRPGTQTNSVGPSVQGGAGTHSAHVGATLPRRPWLRAGQPKSRISRRTVGPLRAEGVVPILDEGDNGGAKEQTAEA
jgi:hypothetical protein